MRALKNAARQVCTKSYNMPKHYFTRLILADPPANRFTLRVTAFSGLLYGLFNLSAWTSPDTMWLEVMHIPLLVLSLAALWLGRK